jgi:hypothetical protein
VTVVPATRDDVLRSRSGHYIALLIARADAVMPPEIHEVLNPYLDRLEHELGEDIEAATGAGDGESATNTPRGTDSATSKHVSPIGFSTDKSKDETAGETRLLDALEGPAFPALRVPARRPGDD